MLHEADVAIVARDRELPGLRLLLDAAAFADAIGVGGVTLSYLRYKPGESCLAAFRLPDGRELAAKAVTARRWAAVCANPKWAAPHLGCGTLPRRLEAAQVLLRDRTEDAHLKALRRLSDPERAERCLNHLFRHRAVKGPFSLVPMRWKPERRFVARVDGRDGPIAVLKVSAPSDYARSLAGAAFAEAAGGPPFAAASAALGAFAVRWADGVPLCPAADGAFDLDGTAAAGRALAALHQASIVHPHTIDRVAYSEALRAGGRYLGWLLPGIANRARHLAERVAAALATEAAHPCLVHGDFSADQVVICEGGACIIDWDEAACGEPAADFGTFYARLEVQALDSVIARDAAEAAQEALLAGYAETSEPPPELRGHTARALLMLATEGFRARYPDWPERAAALLDRAQAALDGPRPFVSVLARALSRRAAAPLSMAFGTPVHRLDRPRLERLKHGRRALVAYRAELVDGTRVAAMGKARAKGLDGRASALHAGLRKAGFADDAPDRVMVPEPLGEAPELSLWLQRRVEGRPATEFLTPEAGPLLARRIGRALAKLHATEVDLDRSWRVADELRVLQRRFGELAGYLPALAADASLMGAGCAAVAARLQTALPRPLHRDFYPDQVLVAGDALWLVDLDLAAMGDPALDVGNFAAHLVEAAVRHWRDPAALDHHVSAFVTGWREMRPPERDDRVAAWTVLALARCVAIAASRPDRRYAASALAAVTIAKLEEFGTLPSPRLIA